MAVPSSMNVNPSGRLEAPNNDVCRIPLNTKIICQGNKVFTPIEAVYDLMSITGTELGIITRGWLPKRRFIIDLRKYVKPKRTIVCCWQKFVYMPLCKT